MPKIDYRNLPGYFYAEAITEAFIRDVKSVPYEDKEGRERKLLAALDYGRTLLNVAEPLARAHGFPCAYADLYQRIQNLARPWRDDGKEQFIESPKVELVLDVLYEVQREIRELKKKRRITVAAGLGNGRAA